MESGWLDRVLERRRRTALWVLARMRRWGAAATLCYKRNFRLNLLALRSKLRNERYWSGELRHVRKDGREVIVDSRMQLLGDDTVLEVNRDVTEIKALITQQATLVQELSAAAAKFEALFNQSGIFAGIMDLQGYLQEANKLSLRVVRVHQRAGSQPTLLGHSLVARLRRDEGADTFCYGSSCFGARFSRGASILGSRRQRTYRRLCDAPHSGPVGGSDVPASHGGRHY